MQAINYEFQPGVELIRVDEIIVERYCAFLPHLHSSMHHGSEQPVSIERCWDTLGHALIEQC